MPARIMVVEDDASARRLLEFIFQKEGFEVTACEHGQDALDVLEKARPDVFVVDLMMPVMDGIQLVKALRSRPAYQAAPILVLTARDQMVDKYEAFSAGADDYVTKPFDPMELLFRIRAFMRRAGAGAASGEAAPGDAEAGVGRVRLDAATFTAQVDGREVQLTRLETAVLGYLMAHANEVVPAERLAAQVLDGATSVDAAHAHIRHLRKKLESDPANPQLLITVGRKGYRYMG